MKGIMKNDQALKLMIIKTNSNVYVSDNIKGDSYFNSRIGHLYFDGKLPEESYKKDWFIIDKVPEKIEKKKAAKRVNQRYELKEGFSETDLTPKVVSFTDMNEDSDFYEVKGLYDYKYELEDEGFENVDFELHTVEEVDGDFKITKNEYNLQYNLLDRITTHPVLLPTKPCKLSSEETYKIIRAYVKNYIDPKYAVITSDYDFCFTVQKRIELYEPEKYSVNVNALHSRRKPKYETRYRKERKTVVYEAAPKPYQSYTVVEPFTGDNLEDLKNKIDTYLKELIAYINEPVVDCECCKGRGVVVNENPFR
ncbi:MAG: hypothetical protein ACI35O_09020 [Bacillaceae bacterium]